VIMGVETEGLEINGKRGTSSFNTRITTHQSQQVNKQSKEIPQKNIQRVSQSFSNISKDKNAPFRNQINPERQVESFSKAPFDQSFEQPPQCRLR